jgi:hypoxanthine phosphoribosyltransferase
MASPAAVVTNGSTALVMDGIAPTGKTMALAVLWMRVAILPKNVRIFSKKDLTNHQKCGIIKSMKER